MLLLFMAAAMSAVDETLPSTGPWSSVEALLA
jgi:hypothetical protein